MCVVGVLSDKAGNDFQSRGIWPWVLTGEEFSGPSCLLTARRQSYLGSHHTHASSFPRVYTVLKHTQMGWCGQTLPGGERDCCVAMEANPDRSWVSVSLTEQWARFPGGGGGASWSRIECVFFTKTSPRCQA